MKVIGLDLSLASTGVACSLSRANARGTVGTVPTPSTT